jgi:uncharacterized protein YgiM (DUF1202 family)
MRRYRFLLWCVWLLSACMPQSPSTLTSTLSATETESAPVSTTPLVTNTPRPISPSPVPSLEFILPPLTEIAHRPDVPLVTRLPICEDAPRPRLIVGERGRVSMEDMRPLNVRSGPGTDMRIIGRLEVGDIFRVVDGPRCGNNFVWFLVQRLDGSLQGWAAEGEFNFYYVEPYLTG